VADRKKKRRQLLVEGLEDRNLLATGFRPSGVWGALARQTLAPSAFRGFAQNPNPPSSPSGALAASAGAFRRVPLNLSRTPITPVRRTPTPAPPRFRTPAPAPRPAPPPVAPAPTGRPPIVIPPVIVVPPPKPTVDLDATSRAIVDLVNQNRQQQGLAPLTVNARLTEAATIQSEQMVTYRKMEHTIAEAPFPGLVDRINHVGYRYSSAGENIAYGYSDADSVMNGWMNSSGHRANILNSAFTEVGVAVAYNSMGVAYYTQVFGRPSAA